LAFPRRRLAVITGVLVLACALEAAQLLIPGRDGRVVDATVKALGGIVGASAGYGVYPLRRLLKSLHTLGSTTAPTVGPL
jgi:VanZ family protein